jgi:histidine triad (HIT) family protein
MQVMKMENCIFCKIINGEIPSKRIYEDDKVIVMMDINPVVDGHVLVIPKEHKTDFTELDSELLNHIYGVAKKLTPELLEKLNCNSMTFTVNYGDAQVVKHFHLHLLPNYGKSEASKTVDEVYEIIK